MCLTLPKQVISIDKNKVKLKFGSTNENATSIIKVKKGDWVLTQQVVRRGSPLSVIIKKISKKQAEEINQLLRRSE